MIEWKKDLPNGDVCIPIEFEEIEGKGLRICASEEVRSAVLDWESLHASNPFSDASLAFLWQALLPYFEKKGYESDRFRDRWYSVFACDPASVRRESLSLTAIPLTAQTAAENRTTLSFLDACSSGGVAYGIVSDNEILSVALGWRNGQRIEFTVETAPEARGKGYAKAALAAAVSSLEQGKTAYYRCHRYHTASQKTANAVGFQLVGKYYRCLGRRKNGI